MHPKDREVMDGAIQGEFGVLALRFRDLESAVAKLEELLKVDLRERIRQDSPDNRHWDDQVYNCITNIVRESKLIRINAKRIDQYTREAGFVYAG